MADGDYASNGLNLDTESIPTLHLDVECSSDTRAAFSTRPRLKAAERRVRLRRWDGAKEGRQGHRPSVRPSGPPTCMNIGPARGDRGRERRNAITGSLLLVHCDVWLYSHALVRPFVDLVIREGKKCLSHRLNKGTIWGPLRGSLSILVSCIFVFPYV